MTNLSKRETFLLFLMALIVPVALIFQLLIAPLQAQILDKQTQLSGLELQKQQVEANLSTIPSLRLRKEARIKEVDDKLQEFSSPIHASEFERWMLPLFNKYNVKVESAELSPTQLATPTVNASELPSQIYELLVLIQDVNDVEVIANPEVPSTTTQLLFAEYNYTFTTNLENYLDMIDEIQAWDTTFIISGSYFIPSESLASFTLQVYSVHKLSENEVLGIYKNDFGDHPNEVKGPDNPSNPK